MTCRNGQPVRDHAVAAVWGAAEATAFFIVPDVWLSRVALRSRRRAVNASFSALAGAVVGGIATHSWARRTPEERSREALRALPAISGEMVDRCVSEVDKAGSRAMLTGPLRGIPYKLYARAAGLRNLPVGEFAAWSVPARIPRFLLVAVLAAAIRDRVADRLGEERTVKLETPVHAGFWVLFYAWYLRTVGQEPAPEAVAWEPGDSA